ncbi:MAG TPA: hypothetical protein EYG52_05495 [Pseudomonadales bacterium]|nr:hypothetical protein [Gammaproteobacteria bacterium]HIL82954.1 hypothetical protein [Pseudomonadales bacterium]
MDIPSEESVKKVIGHEFPGGEYLIAHWENFLLTECTGAQALPDGMAHPVALFHVPFLGANTSIGEMFELGQASSEFSIGIESYEWEFFKPLMEEELYQISGSILEVERIDNEDGFFDRIKFQFDIRQDRQDIARSTIIWHYNRGRYDRS